MQLWQKRTQPMIKARADTIVDQLKRIINYYRSLAAIDIELLILKYST